MESVPHVLSGCSVLAQSKYKTRHDAALKVLFFDLLCDMGLIESAPSWCSPETPKPEYKNDRASAFWDVPVYAEKTEVRANRIDARVVDKQKKKVLLLEMSCPSMAMFELLDTIIMTRASLRILPLPIFPTLFFSGMPRCLRILVLGSGKSRLLMFRRMGFLFMSLLIAKGQRGECRLGPLLKSLSAPSLPV